MAKQAKKPVVLGVQKVNVKKAGTNSGITGGGYQCC
jgi:hypothetical protein